MIVSYARVSSTIPQKQNLFRQQVILDDEKYHIEKHFEDRCSGKSTNRPKLQEMLDYIRENDVLYVCSMDRLARNLADLLDLVTKITKKGVTIHFVKENLTFSPKEEANAMSKLMLSLMGSFAEFEARLIRERADEGIKIAKEKGVYKNRKRKVPEEKYAEIDRIVSDEGLSLCQACKKVGVSRAMYYVHLKHQKENASKASKEPQNEKA